MSPSPVTEPLPPTVGLILLAAGASRRLGTPKQLLRDATGLSLVRRAAMAGVASGCRPVVAVLGASATEVSNELQDLPVVTVVNSDWRSGMASTLKVGFAAVTPEAAPEAIVVMLCDQPMVTAALLRSLIEARQASEADIVACEYGDALGVPALFAPGLFDQLTTLTGDQGARHVIRAHGGSVARVPFPDGAFDVDTAVDAEMFTRSSARG